MPCNRTHDVVMIGLYVKVAARHVNGDWAEMEPIVDRYMRPAG